MVGVRITASLAKARARRHIDLAPDDRLNALGHARAIKGHGTVHHAVIGEGHCLVSAFLGATRNILDTASAVKQAIFTVKMQMNESRHGIPSFLSRLGAFGKGNDLL